MILRETAGAIWNCYREINVSQKLLLDMEEQRKKNPAEPFAENLRDAFGRRRQLQLGVPSGSDCYRLFDVEADLAIAIIRAHVAHKEAQLLKLNEKARIEFDLGIPSGAGPLDHRV